MYVVLFSDDSGMCFEDYDEAKAYADDMRSEGYQCTIEDEDDGTDGLGWDAKDEALLRADW